MSEIITIYEPEDEVLGLIENGMIDSAFKLLMELSRPLSQDNAFYLAYCQTNMEQEFEALQTLNTLRESADKDIRGTFSAFMADILRDQGNINDTLKEARFALEDCPDDEAIQKLLDEFLDDWFKEDGGKLGLVFTTLVKLVKRDRRAVRKRYNQDKAIPCPKQRKSVMKLWPDNIK